MRRNWFIVVAVFFLVLLSPILLRRNTVRLSSNGEKLVLVTRSVIPAVNNGSVDVCVGKEKAFSLWEDFFDGPLFIYPFAGNRKFLCDYNYDTAIIVFVVDLDSNSADGDGLKWWPNYELRSLFMSGATNVVLQTTGEIRLPTEAELREVSSHISQATENGIKAVSLPYSDFGVYRTYASKEFLLLDLAIDRGSSWPMPGGRN